MRRRAGLAVVLVGILVSLLGCNPKVGLVTLGTNPQGATVYVNETKVGETPVTFEYNMEKPVTLQIVKEGYQPRTEKITADWVKSEYHQGNYGKGEYLIGGKKQTGYEVRTLRDLIKLEGQ